MIHYTNGGCLVERVDELPRLSHARNVFCDIETTSGNESVASTNPWHFCKVDGIAITVDENEQAWYVPIKIGRDAVRDWIAGVLAHCERWTNHNVKYDAHVLRNDLGIHPPNVLVDTLTLSKIIDSDKMYRGGYGLKTLSEDWLGEDISEYEASLQPYLHLNKDYGRIPDDIEGAYACQDVLTNRKLWKYIDGKCPDQCRDVWGTEIGVTRALYDVEQQGLCIDPTALKIEEFKVMRRLLEIDEELTEIVGYSFRPHVRDDCFDVLCGTYGMPVLKRTDPTNENEEGNPSFDKDALSQYEQHPLAPVEVVKRISEYRTLNQFANLFLRPYQTLHTEGRLHPTYNQAVRTGRMSCSQPNSQQLNKRAKSLIHPAPENSFIAVDYSQIEFRIIVHYIKAQECIDAYNENPDTDFHSWVAGMVPMPRQPAKTVNFLAGYGGGKKLLMSKLLNNKEVVADIVKEMGITDGNLTDEVQREFHLASKRRAEDVYRRYHTTLPTLKTTSRLVAATCRKRGHVWNLYGRHRHLQPEFSHKGFNSICQSSAADLIKERLLALREVIPSELKIVAIIHDDITFEGPTELCNDEELQREIIRVMESPPIDLRVPIRAVMQVDSESLAMGNAKEIQFPYEGKK